MIVIELRIGRVPAAQAADERAVAAPPRVARSVGERRWRLGNGTAAAVLATALGGIALAFVPAGETPEAHTLSVQRLSAQPAAMSPSALVSTHTPMNAGAIAWAAAGEQAERATWVAERDVVGNYSRQAPAPHAIGWDRQFAEIVDVATTRAMQQAQQQVADGAPETELAASAEPSAPVAGETASGWPAWYQDQRNTQTAVDTRMLNALSRDVSASATARTAPTQPVDGSVRASPDESMRSAVATTEEPVSADVAPATFTITRDPSAPVQGLLQALREHAATGDWAAVQQLRETSSQAYGLPASLALAKWDARIALTLGHPEAALAALAPYLAEFDDEGARLQAVSLLRAGDANSAVSVYRTLLGAHPDDAQLWLGLGMALEASQADSEAVRFAYGQSLQLADDAAMRQVAQAHLDAHQA